MCRNTFFIVYFCFGLVQGVVGYQKFATEPTYTEANPGDTTIMICKVLDIAGDCVWQINHSNVINKEIEGKYEWAGNTSTGDCSIKIINVQLDAHDGEWKCQVGESKTQTGLTSSPAKLLVRVEPKPPKITFSSKSAQNGKIAVGEAGQNSTFKCVSERGNPPAKLKWFIGNEEIFPGTEQRNQQETDYSKRKTWSATSELSYTFKEAHNSRKIKCKSIHPLNTTETEVGLDVQYAPEVTIINIPPHDVLEDNNLSIKCDVDANPSVVGTWKKENGSVHGLVHKVDPNILQFIPLKRIYNGIYICSAKNHLGTSQSPPFKLDVKYPPKILEVYPKGAMEVSLYNSTMLRCVVEGNPEPTYEWLQQKRNLDGPERYVRGTEAELFIHNFTYVDQGNYTCKARNKICGEDRETASEPVDITVVGAPQILRDYRHQVIEAATGSEATCSMIFCSNPKYNKIYWEFGSRKFFTDRKYDRYLVRPIETTPMKNCYEAKFILTNVDPADSRHYYLNVENSEGVDRYSINLQVRDPISMYLVIAFIIGCLVALVIVLVLICYSFFAKKWCFSERGDFKPRKESHKNGSRRNGHPFASTPDSGSYYAPAPAPAESSRPITPITPPPQVRQFKRQQARQIDTTFRGRPYETVVKYSDLQVPKISNNGSMRKYDNGNNKIEASPQLSSASSSFKRYQPTAPQTYDAMFSGKRFMDLQEAEV